MVGLDAAGKTTILYYFKLGDIVSSAPTIGFNVETLKYNRLTLTVWDIGGQSKVRPLWKHYYQNTNGIIFVVDSSDVQRVDEAALELRQIFKENELTNTPILVFANKQDLPNALSVSELMNRLDLHSERNRAWHVQSACAKTGAGLYEGLDWLSTQLVKN